MGFEEDVQEAERKIQAEYDALVVSEYFPLFERLKKEALEAMNSRGIAELRLGIMSVKLHFKRDGLFHLIGQESTAKLEDIKNLPGLYQEEAVYIEDLADMETNRAVSYHEAMRDALNDFEQTIRKYEIN